jgi:hypothetical protein
MELRSVEVVDGVAGEARPKLGVLTASGSVSFPAERSVPSRTGWTVTFAGPTDATGIVVRGHGARSVADTSTVTTTAGARFALNGPFQDALGQATWHPTGFWRGYARFKTFKLGPQVAVRGAPGASVRRVSTTQWGTETDLVDTPSAATVVRSEAYLAGWQVKATPVGGGPTRILPVFAVGLIQGVRVPPGRWSLQFGFWPSGLAVGGVASALGVAAVLAVATACLWRRRRSRERPAPGTGR